MQETIEQLLQLIQGAWRYRAWALLTAWVICPIGWLVVAAQPNIYEAKARVLVNASSDLREVLDNQIVEVGGEHELKVVRETMLGTDRLEQLINETELSNFATTAEERRGLVDLLREQILIVSESEARRVRRRPGETFLDAYQVVYASSSREGAVNIVTKLLEIFERDVINANRSVDGEQFLLGQKEDYEERLRAAEKALADFNRRNYDRMPNLQGGYFEQLQDESTALESARTELRLANSRLESLDQQLRGESIAFSSGEVVEGSLEDRIRSNQTRLDELKLLYTDKHPDVIATEEALVELRQQHAELTERLRQGDLVAVTNNPVYQAIRISQNEVKTEIARLEASVQEKESRLARLRGLIDEMPAVEAELAQLTRDTQVIQEQYQAILESLERERLSRQVSETVPLGFQILDPPRAGTDPVAPNRPIQHLLVFVLGVGIAGALVVALGQLMPVYSRASQIAEDFNVAVIGWVSEYSNEAKQRLQFRSHAWFAVGASLLLVAFVGVLGVEVQGPGLRSMVLG